MCVCVSAYHERVFEVGLGDKRGGLFIRSVKWEEIDSKRICFSKGPFLVVGAHDMYLIPTTVDRGSARARGRR